MLSTQESNMLLSLRNNPFVNQRILSEVSGYSLGIVNKTLHSLVDSGFLDDSMRLTKKAYKLIKDNSPRNAVILAAGFGMRMVPINMTTPKALIEVRGERLIDRLIRQLQEVGVEDIAVVVGFMKDSFEYLIDEFGVRLIYAADYAKFNNLHSLYSAAYIIGNTYIVPCDIWCADNPFRHSELCSWYMVSDQVDEESDVRINRKKELVKVSQHSVGNRMIGISYLTGEDAKIVKERLNCYVSENYYNDKFWEETLYNDDRMFVSARIVHFSNIVEINTYEQLRAFDSDSDQLKSEAFQIISEEMNCAEKDIVDIEVLKKGMTNRSFLFRIERGNNTGKYIMRIPGEGTDQLINRRQEAEVFSSISGLGLCDDPVYINPQNGYKITRYLDGVRVCNPENEEDLKKCMRKLREFHEMKLKVQHTFDIFGQIEFYESLWNGTPSVYRDYQNTKNNVMSLRKVINSFKCEWCLTHIDAVPDNFLFYHTKDGTEKLQLTDWEYSGMQDPHVDIAMFCIYALYDKDRTDRLIDIYFEGNCSRNTRAKIYCYVAMCGLLWSNWCEYKRNIGIEFGEYSLCQYRYAKEFFKYAINMLEE